MSFGEALLQELESCLKKQGLEKLKLHASLNAISFYAQNSFNAESEVNH